MAEDTIEIIPDRLYWVASSVSPKSKPNSFYICTDEILKYSPLNLDFGPLNLSMLYTFCIELKRILTSPAYEYQRIIHCTSQNYKEKLNSAYLMASFQVLVLGKSAYQAYSLFKPLNLKSFRDAGEGDCAYQCTLFHCLNALQRAMRLNWFTLDSFNFSLYTYFEKVENGDMNWIIPNKLLAFSCPSAYPVHGLSIKTYAHVFNKLNIGTVIRINKKRYEESGFTSHGLQHFSLHFPDGGVPNTRIIEKFLEICIREPQGLAVHCKAGLGRTGTLIGCYAIKVLQFPADEFIAWCRICRPGSIIASQQDFLLDFERTCKSMRPLRNFYDTSEISQSKRLLNSKSATHKRHQTYC